MSRSSGRYPFRELQQRPLPVGGPGRLPLMIGGEGEKKTLRSVARYAQGWNAAGNVEFLRHKAAVLQRHCDAVRRDPLEIEFTTNRYLVLRDDTAEAARALLQVEPPTARHLPDPARLPGPRRRCGRPMAHLP